MNEQPPLAFRDRALQTFLAAWFTLATLGIIVTFAALITWIVALQTRLKQAETRITALDRYCSKLEGIVAQFKVDGKSVFDERPDRLGYSSGGKQ